MNQASIWNTLYKNRFVWKKETQKLPKSLKGKNVLELGVGTGKTLISILRQNPKSITAIDFSKYAIKKAKKPINSKKIKFINADILTYSFNKKFDIIVCYYLMNNLLKYQRKQLAGKLYSMLNAKGIILFEDFAVGDFRQNQGIEIEKNTIIKNGLICHFFKKSEIKALFKNFKKIKIKAKTFFPIRTKKLKRKIISAIIRK